MILSTLCYLEKNGQYLMLHRTKKENDINHDKWIGIGGKFEAGESPEECIHREFFEETGLCISDPRFCGIITFVSDLYETEYMHLFYADAFSGHLKECDEGKLEWIDKKLLRNKKLWEGDHIFLDLMEEDRPFFSLKLEYQGNALQRAVLDGKEILNRA